MTSLLIWVGADQRGPASLNMATDSRLTWEKNTFWDETQKVYACREKPFIFAFCGISEFPTAAIPRIISELDAGLLKTFESIESAIRKMWEGYPDSRKAAFTIYIGRRSGEKLPSTFSLMKLSLRDPGSGGRWEKSMIPVTPTSEVLVVDGSGKAVVEKYLNLWNRTPSKRTSRAYYSALSDAITSPKGDPSTGGAPQIGGLYRVGGGRLFGVVHEDDKGIKRRYFAGRDLTGRESVSGVEWRNNLFERTDPSQKELLKGAQPHEPRRIELRQT